MPRRLPGQEAGGRPVGAACALLWVALAAFACGASADDRAAAVEPRPYVATAANCFGCHTREGGAAYSGGRALATPLGTIHSTNITPDRETGIGNWSAQDLKRALREGIAADGRHLFPAFPYPFYTRMTDADIADLYAYLRTLNPVRYVPPGNDRRVPDALADGALEGAEPRARRLRARTRRNRPNGTVAPTWCRVPGTAAPATRRATGRWPRRPRRRCAAP